MRPDGEERRAERRHLCKVKISYSFDSPSCSGGPWENYTTDLSFTGMGFFSKCPAKAGQKIMIFLKYVFEAPRLAEVRWCNKLDTDLYKIGIRYCRKIS